MSRPRSEKNALLPNVAPLGYVMRHAHRHCPGGSYHQVDHRQVRPKDITSGYCFWFSTGSPWGPVHPACGKITLPLDLPAGQCRMMVFIIDETRRKADHPDGTVVMATFQVR